MEEEDPETGPPVGTPAWGVGVREGVPDPLNNQTIPKDSTFHDTSLALQWLLPPLLLLGWWEPGLPPVCWCQRVPQGFGRGFEARAAAGPGGISGVCTCLGHSWSGVSWPFEWKRGDALFGPPLPASGRLRPVPLTELCFFCHLCPGQATDGRGGLAGSIRETKGRAGW